MTNVKSAAQASVDRIEANIAAVVAEVKPFVALPKADLLKVLENKATALLGMANASQIGVEREGLRFQAYALRQAVTMLRA